MKIIVVGAGLSGLSCSIALRKYLPAAIGDEELEVKIYDKPQSHAFDSKEYTEGHKRLKNQGAAISLQANALRVLTDLDPKLAQSVISKGYPCSHFTWKTSGNWVLGRQWLNLLPISRPALIDCLIAGLGNGVQIKSKSVVGVRTQKGERAVVLLDGGEEEDADLVIGADGIHSAVRETLLSKDEVEKYRPKYLGQCAVGGVLQHGIDSKSMTEDSAITFIVDSSGVFVYCPLDRLNKDKMLCGAFYDSELPLRSAKLNRNDITSQFRERHSSWIDPVVKDCLKHAELDNIWPVFYMPDLPHWGHDGVVLIGDAAHAMTPSTGQGGSQAFEDGQSLALILAGLLQRRPNKDAKHLQTAVENTIQGFYNVRHSRVEQIKVKGLSLREPKRPWSFITRISMFVGLFLVMKYEYVKRLLGITDPVLDWDGKKEVDAYLSQ